jgi:FkbM family methyltransferase
MSGVQSIFRAAIDFLIKSAPRSTARLACHALLIANVADRLTPARAAQLRRVLEAPDGQSGAEAREESYAQEGEDLVLSRHFGDKIDGFYVDVGAHHPVRHSNTYLLYRRGWHGINIDATPGSMEPFRRIRSRDINVECLVASDPAPRSFFMLNEPALNTASQSLARQRPNEDRHFRVTDTVTLTPRSLTSLLDEFLPRGRAIDLMNVDVEGLDLDVLRSNDWDRYRPTLLLVELLETPLEALERHEIVLFLRDKSYRPIAKLYNTVVFRERS